MEVDNINPLGQGPSPAPQTRRPAQVPDAPEKPAPSPESNDSGDEVTLSPQARSALDNLAPVETNPQVASLINNLERIRSLTQNDELVVQVVDPETDEVVRQIPAEGSLKLREAIRNILDQSLGNL